MELAISRELGYKDFEHVSVHQREPKARRQIAGHASQRPDFVITKYTGYTLLHKVAVASLPKNQTRQ